MSEEKKFVVVKFDEARLQDVFAGKDGQMYCSILVAPDMEFVRKMEQIRNVKDEPGMKQFSLTSDFEPQVRQRVKDENEKYTTQNTAISLESLQDKLAEPEVTAFVSFMVNKSSLSDVKLNANGEAYRFVRLDGVGSIVRSEENLHPVKNNDDKVRFSIPSANKLSVNKSVRIPGVPDDAPNNEKFKNERVEMTPFEIKTKMVRKAMREKEREEMPAQNRGSKAR